MTDTADEKWGCWDGEDEIVSAIQPSKEGAIEEYANDYLLCELDHETETRTFDAVVSLGRPVLLIDQVPSFDSFVESLEQSAADNEGMDDELVNMTKEELADAEKVYDKMMSEFVNTHLKQREWSVFPCQQEIVIKIVNGEYAGWEPKNI